MGRLSLLGYIKISHHVADLIVADIEVSQRCGLCQHSCKALCPDCSDQIAADIEVSQRCALHQHSGKALCPDCSDLITSRTTSVQEYVGALDVTLSFRFFLPLQVFRIFLPQAFSKATTIFFSVDWEIVDRAVDSHSEGVLEES